MSSEQDQFETALYILHRIAETDGRTSVQTLHENLTAPWGWWALCWLIDNRYVTTLGDEAIVTDAGMEMAGMLDGVAV